LQGGVRNVSKVGHARRGNENQKRMLVEALRFVPRFVPKFVPKNPPQKAIRWAM